MKQLLLRCNKDGVQYYEHTATKDEVLSLLRQAFNHINDPETNSVPVFTNDLDAHAVIMQLIGYK